MGSISSNVDPTARALAAVGIADAAAAQSTANDALAGSFAGASWANISGSIISGALRTNTSLQPIAVSAYPYAVGTTLLNVGAITVSAAVADATSSSPMFVIVPPGETWSITTPGCTVLQLG